MICIMCFINDIRIWNQIRNQWIINMYVNIYMKYDSITYYILIMIFDAVKILIPIHQKLRSLMDLIIILGNLFVNTQQDIDLIASFTTCN